MGELDHVGTDGTRATIYNQGRRLFSRRPGIRESEAEVQTDGGCHVCQGQGGCFFERQVLGNVECGVLPPDGVLCKTAMWLHHLVERGDAISRLEFPNIAAYTVDNASDIVPRVGVVLGDEFWDFPVKWSGILIQRMVSRQLYVPVFGVASADNDLNDDLVWSRLRDRYILDYGLKAFGHLCFLHLEKNFKLSSQN